MKLNPKVCAWPGCDESSYVEVGDETAVLALCDKHAADGCRRANPDVWAALKTLKQAESGSTFQQRDEARCRVLDGPLKPTRRAVAR